MDGKDDSTRNEPGFENLSPDAPAEEDLLGRRPLARRIARTIHEYDSEHSITVGLFGSWGAGKTTLLRMIREEFDDLCTPRPPRSLRDRDSVASDLVSRLLWPWGVKHKTSYESWTVFEFNPWMTSNLDDLISKFLKGLASHVDTTLEGENAQKVGEPLRLFGHALSLAEDVPGGGVLGPISKALDFAGKKFDQIGGNELSNLSKVKDEVDHAISDSDYKILVTIDDLDRVSDEKIVQVFQLVRAVADFPNTVFLIACDRDVVVNALDNVHEGLGNEFLDKIIQVPVQIPDAPARTIKKFVRERIVKRLAKAEADSPPCSDSVFADFETFWRAGLNEYYGTLRAAKRMENTLAFRFKLISREVNPIDFLVLESLRIFQPEAYEYVHSHPEFASQTGDHRLEVDGTYADGGKHAGANDDLETLRDELDSPGDVLVMDLFPTHFGVDMERRDTRVKSIEHEQFFPRYFGFRVPHDAISEKDFHELTSEPNFRAPTGSDIVDWWRDNRPAETFFWRLLYSKLDTDDFPYSAVRKSLATIGREIARSGEAPPRLLALCWVRAAFNSYRERPLQKTEQVGDDFDSCWSELLASCDPATVIFAMKCRRVLEDVLKSDALTVFRREPFLKQKAVPKRLEELQAHIPVALRKFLGRAAQKRAKDVRRMNAEFQRANEHPVLWIEAARQIGRERVWEVFDDAPMSLVRDTGVVALFADYWDGERAAQTQDEVLAELKSEAPDKADLVEQAIENHDDLDPGTILSTE